MILSYSILWIVFIIPLSYLILLALASMRKSGVLDITNRQPVNRFVIAIPAHNEAAVIRNTIERLLKLDYPNQLFSVQIVADHCSDNTAEIARKAGAIVHERNTGPRTGKGGALQWLFERILAKDQYDAVVVFDADTQVDSQFLRVMDARLAEGSLIIQGQHIISNPDDGWFPALTWAMFKIDNRFQNLGRTNLGWSAKNMGDSICVHTKILRDYGWGTGLTEDYNFRQRMLLLGIKIIYEPAAIGYGEAARTWMQARAQRTRWIRGTYDSSTSLRRTLLHQAVRIRDGALLDGALQAFFPSYSTLTILALLIFLSVIMADLFLQPLPLSLLWAWLIVVLILLFYPLFGLFLEQAPLKSYLAIMSGPLFILWRTWLAFSVRFGRGTIIWVRTKHGDRQ